MITIGLNKTVVGLEYNKNASKLDKYNWDYKSLVESQESVNVDEMIMLLKFLQHKNNDK